LYDGRKAAGGKAFQVTAPPSVSMPTCGRGMEMEMTMYSTYSRNRGDMDGFRDAKLCVRACQPASRLAVLANRGSREQGPRAQPSSTSLIYALARVLGGGHATAENTVSGSGRARR
jgi:hypothetical protein